MTELKNEAKKLVGVVAGVALVGGVVVLATYLISYAMSANENNQVAVTVG